MSNIYILYVQYFLYGLSLLCLTGTAVSFIIFGKLTLMFKSTNFINKMFTVFFLCNSLLSSSCFFWLFKIGFQSFSDSVKPSPTSEKDLINSCSYFLVTLFSSQVILITGNAGILFCRFLYVRHARGLVTEGVSIFHRLVIILVGCFTCQLLFLFPFSGLIKYYDIYPPNMRKGI